MADDQPSRLLHEMVSRLELSENARSLLLALCEDAHGYEWSIAPSLAASYVKPQTNDSAAAAIGELLASDLVAVTSVGSERRLRANTDALNLGPCDRDSLAASGPVLDSQGQPHSPGAMQGLEMFLDATQGIVYLGVEVTSHHVFEQALLARAASGRRTILFMPRRTDVSAIKRLAYADELNGWIAFVRQAPASLRNNLRIRITSVPFRDLYTTAISRDNARVNVRSYANPSTRAGQMLVAPRGTTLHDLLASRYAEALRQSVAIGSLWLLEFLFDWARRVALPVLVLGGGLIVAIVTSNVVTFVLSFVASAAVAMIPGLSGGIRRWTHTLFSE